MADEPTLADAKAFLQQQKVPDVYGLPELQAGDLRIQGPPVEGQYSQAEADKQAQDYPEETYAHHVGLPDIQGPDTGMPVPTQPGMQFETSPQLASVDDAKAFLASRKDQDTAAIRQRATGIINQYRTDPNFHLPAEWLDSLAREATAGTTPGGQVKAAAKGISEAFVPMPGSEALFGTPLPTLIPTGKTAMATLGMLGDAAKSTGQFISEIGDPDFARKDVRGGAAHGVAKGMLGLDALVANTEQAVKAPFQSEEERVQALKQIWQQDHENAATVKNLDNIMSYQQGTAPGTEAVSEFGATALPFAAMPELGAASKIIPNVASKIVEDVIPGVVGGVGRVAPTAWNAATGTFNVAAKVIPPLAKVKKLYTAASGLLDMLSSYAPEAKNAAELGVQTPLFKYGDLVKSLTDTPEGMTFVEPMQRGIKDEIVRLNDSFDLQAKAAGDKVDLNNVRSTQPNGKFTVDTEHLNPQEQKLRQIQQQLIDQRSKFDTLENYSKVINLGKDAAKLGVGTGLTMGAGGVTMGGIAGIQAMPDDVERAAMEGVPAGMALTTPALLPEGIKTMQASREGRIKAAGDYQAFKGSQVPPHPDAAPLTEQGQRAVNIVNGSIWEGGGKAVAVTPENLVKNIQERGQSDIQDKLNSGEITEDEANKQLESLKNMKPEQAPMGWYDDKTMTAFLRNDAVEKYGQNGPVGHEFTHALDQLTGDTAQKAYGTILGQVKDPAMKGYLQNFLGWYMQGLRRTDPLARTLSLDSLMREGAAELTRYILAKTPLEELASGKTYQKVISDKIGDAIAAIRGKSNDVQIAPGFGTPFTRQQYRAMEDAIYDWGKQVRRGDVRRPAEAPEGAAPAGAAPASPDVEIPPEVSRLNKQWDVPEDILKQAVQRAGPKAVPADIMADAINSAYGGAKAGVAPAEPTEGKPPVNEWEDEANRRVKEFMDQGIPEDQAVMQAADAMKDWEQNRPPIGGGGIAGKFMPEMAPDTEEFKRWSGGAPVILNSGPKTVRPEDMGLQILGNDNDGYTVAHADGTLAFGGTWPKLSLQQAADAKARLAVNMAEAAQHNSQAHNFQTGQPVVVGAYHGTPSDEFHTFDTSKLGEYTGAPSAKQGFFFSGLPDTAETYKGGLMFPYQGFKDMSIKQRGDLSVKVRDHMVADELGPNGRWRMERHWGSAKDYRRDFNTPPTNEALERWALVSQDGTRIESNLDQAEAEKKMNDHNAAAPHYSSTYEYAMAHPELLKGLATQITGKELDMTPADIGHLHEVYVKMQNPYVYDFKGNPYREQTYNDLLRSAKAAGHDGAIFTNTYDGGGKPDNIFVTFDNKNIKSTANMGSFDPSNPDIRYMPQPDNPDAVKGAAIKLPDGKILTGSWHGAIDKQVPPEFKKLAVDGFVTGNGRFLTRDEAWVVGNRFGQIPKYARPLNKEQLASGEHARPQLISEDIRPPAYMPQINVGLERTGHENLKPEHVVDALRGAGINVTNTSQWHPEGGEPTMVASLHRPMTQDEGNAVAKALGQQAIPQYHLGKGEMFVPEPDKLANPEWANFNPDYFLDHNGYSLTENAAKSKQGRIGASGIWDRMTVDPNFMQGEFEKAAEATGANPKERFTRQTPAAQKAIQDYFMGRGEAQYMPSPAGELKWTSRHFDMTPDQLEQFLIFGRSVAGHASKDRAPMIERALTDLLTTQGGTSPITALQKLNQTEGGIEAFVRKHGFGPYGENIRFLKHLAESRIPDLKTATEEELMNIPGIGPKTARFFKAHTDATRANNVMLDTHILRFLRETGHPDAPMSTPQDPKVYQKWSEAFRNAADEFGLSPSDLDLQIWLDRSGNMPTASYKGLEAIGADRQFMPNPHPDAIKEAAIKLPDGKIFTGPAHGAAERAAEKYYKGIGGKAYAKFNQWLNEPNYDAGFVNNKDEYLDREQAFNIGRKLNQIPEYWQHSPLTQPYEMGPELESTKFHDMRRFMPDPELEKQINLARSLAEEAHKGQERKFTGTPYYGHLSDVADLVDDKLKPAAYLHDVFEDTPLRVADLRAMGISNDNIELIRNLTRRPNEDYDHYIQRIKGNPDARDIKMADLWHNLSTLPVGHSLQKRYVKAMNELIPTDEQLHLAHVASGHPERAEKVGGFRDTPAGTPMTMRIDIPAYLATGEYSISGHEGNMGDVKGYDGIATIDNPVFKVNQSGAEKVKNGVINKYPMAAISGEFNPSRVIPNDIGDYQMAGFNPKKHAYLYEKGSFERDGVAKPIKSGDQAISAGNTVFVKNPVYGNPAEYKFMPDVPQAIDRAAIKRNSDGKIFSAGQNTPHWMIPSEHPDIGNYFGANADKEYQNGFLDNQQNFHDRETAHQIMTNNGQLPKDYQGEYSGEANVTDLRKSRAIEKLAEEKPPEPGKPLAYMPSTPEDAAAAIEEGKQKFPEAFPRDYEKDKDGNYKLKYDKQAKKKQYVPVEKPFDLTQSGLYAQSKDQADFENKMVDKVVQEHNNIWSKDPETMQAKGWYDIYNTMREKGMSHEQATRFLDTAAATSARARAGSQFVDSLEAHNRMEAGDFDEIIKKYKEAYDKQKAGDLTFNKDYTSAQKKTYKEGDPVDSASAFRDYVEANGLVLRKSSGKRFGMHSYKVLQVMAGHYVPEGLKYVDFFNALTGRSTNPVIDIWSYRNIDRLANEGYKPVWRRLPENEPGVNDPDYLTSRRIMLEAAKKLGYDNPTDLQAIQWFGEKKQWYKNKWARDLDLGDYRPLLQRFEPVPGAKGTQFRLADVQPPG